MCEEQSLKKPYYESLPSSSHKEWVSAMSLIARPQIPPELDDPKVKVKENKTPW